MGQAEKEKSLLFSRRLELVLAGCLYYSGLVKLARWWSQRSGSKLSILCYHQASGGYLREHLLYFKRHYRLLHLEAALEELHTTRKDKQRSKDRRPLLALTFDDGYHDFSTHGMPLAAELQAPLTGFLVPGYVDSGKRFWWLEPEYLLLHAQGDTAKLQGQRYNLQNLVEKQALRAAIDAGLRHASSVAEREAFLENARSALALPSSNPLDEQENILTPLNWAEVREMEQNCWISFGAHTMHHPILAYLASADELTSEVSNCRVALEEYLGHPVRTFAYPVGKNEHIGEAAIEAVRAAGYTWAVTCIHGLNTPHTDSLSLSRIVVDVDQHWLMVAAKTSGLWDFLVHLGRMPVAFLRNMFK